MDTAEFIEKFQEIAIEPPATWMKAERNLSFCAGRFFMIIALPEIMPNQETDKIFTLAWWINLSGILIVVVVAFILVCASTREELRRQDESKRSRRAALQVVSEISGMTDLMSAEGSLKRIADANRLALDVVSTKALAFLILEYRDSMKLLSASKTPQASS